MSRNLTSSGRLALSEALPLVFLLVALPAFAGPSSRTPPNGAQSPSRSRAGRRHQFLARCAPVPVPATARKVSRRPPQVMIVDVFDASGSTERRRRRRTCSRASRPFDRAQHGRRRSGAGQPHRARLFRQRRCQGRHDAGGGDDQLGASADGNTVVNSISSSTAASTTTSRSTRRERGRGRHETRRRAGQVLAELTASTAPRSFLILASDGLSNAGTSPTSTPRRLPSRGLARSPTRSLWREQRLHRWDDGNLADNTVNGGSVRGSKTE